MPGTRRVRGRLSPYFASPRIALSNRCAMGTQLVPTGERHQSKPLRPPHYRSRGKVTACLLASVIGPHAFAAAGHHLRGQIESCLLRPRQDRQRQPNSLFSWSSREMPHASGTPPPPRCGQGPKHH